MKDILKDLFDEGKITKDYLRAQLDANKIDLETFLFITSSLDAE